MRKKELHMPGYRTQVLVNFVVRAVIGTALIFFVNQFLNARGIDIRVGMNPVTVVTSGVLGTPGDTAEIFIRSRKCLNPPERIFCELVQTGI